MKGEINLIKDADIERLKDLKESLEDDIKPKRNSKKRIKQELIENESNEDLNKYKTDDEIVMPVIKEEPEVVIPSEQSVKTIETGQLTEDKVKVLLDEQYERIDKMIDNKMSEYNYRMYNSFKAEFRRWYEGYYDQIK